MSQWQTPAQLRSLERGFGKRVETPIPTQIVSSGECYPPPQSRRQAQVEALIGAGVVGREAHATVWRSGVGLNRASLGLA